MGPHKIEKFVRQRTLSIGQNGVCVQIFAESCSLPFYSQLGKGNNVNVLLLISE